MTTAVANVQRLRDVCTPDGDFDACTRFVAFRLTATCSLRDDRWAIDASATFRPWIFLHNMHSLDHEHLHISDIHGLAERYVEELMHDSFATREACEATALAASSGFEVKMREFARRSNEQRHRALLRASR